MCVYVCVCKRAILMLVFHVFLMYNIAIMMFDDSLYILMNIILSYFFLFREAMKQQGDRVNYQQHASHL